MNALRAFEAAARHLSFTRAGSELNVTQAAVSAQVRNLESRLGVQLFRRLSRGLALTDEGQALLPMVSQSFGQLEAVLDQFRSGTYREPLTVASVASFTVGWLLPRLERFNRTHPFVDLRLMTHNNKVDLAGEGLDYAIRFGDGSWQATHAEAVLDTPLVPMCVAGIAERLSQPRDLLDQPLLRSYRRDEWPSWFTAAGVADPPVTLRGPMFDTSLALAAAAAQGAGVALLPASLFQRELDTSVLVQPFRVGIQAGRYWLTRLHSRRMSNAMLQFRQWLLQEAAESCAANTHAPVLATL